MGFSRVYQIGTFVVFEHKREDCYTGRRQHND